MQRMTPRPEPEDEPISTSFEDLAGPDLFDSSPVAVRAERYEDDAVEPASYYAQEGARVVGGEEAGQRKPIRMEALGASGYEPTPFWRGSLVMAAMSVATLVGSDAIADLAAPAVWGRYMVLAPVFFAAVSMWWGVRGVLAGDSRGGRVMSIIGATVGAFVAVCAAGGVVRLF